MIGKTCLRRTATVGCGISCDDLFMLTLAENPEHA
jgi:hypothetical protein